MNTPFATLVNTGVTPEHTGAAPGLMNTAKHFGGALGPAVATTVAPSPAGGAFVLMTVALPAVIAAMTTLPTPAAGRTGDSVLIHFNAPLSVEGRHRQVGRCKKRARHCRNP